MEAIVLYKGAKVATITGIGEANICKVDSTSGTDANREPATMSTGKKNLLWEAVERSGELVETEKEKLFLLL